MRGLSRFWPWLQCVYRHGRGSSLRRQVSLVGRGVDAHRAYAAIYPASIVIYAQPQGHAAKAIRDSAASGVSALRTPCALWRMTCAGAHSSRIVSICCSPDVADAERMVRQSAGASKPTVLPVMYSRRRKPGHRDPLSVPARRRSRRPLPLRVDNAMKARAEAKRRGHHDLRSALAALAVPIAVAFAAPARAQAWLRPKAKAPWPRCSRTPS
jgi:hypothetical protein